VTAADPFSGLPEPSEPAGAVPDLQPMMRNAGTAEQATEWCKAGEAAAMEVDPRITNSEGAEFDAGSHLVLYASSNGFQSTYRSSSCSLSVVPVASNDGKMERDHWYSVQRHLAKLDAPEEIGRTAAARVLRRLGARKLETREVPVVFDPDMAASLLRHLAGAVSGSALYRGMSFLTGKLGETIAPAFVTVYDDGTLPSALGSKPFDGEGLPTRRTPVIERGVLTNYLFDTYSARKMQSRSTGNAARSVADSPHVSPQSDPRRRQRVAGGDHQVGRLRPVCHRADGVRGQSDDRRLLARCQRSVDRGRRARLSGERDHHRRQLVADVPGHRSRRQRPGAAPQHRGPDHQDLQADRRRLLSAARRAARSAFVVRRLIAPRRKRQTRNAKRRATPAKPASLTYFVCQRRSSIAPAVSGPRRASASGSLRRVASKKLRLR
jgi:hypothetical protein